MMNIASSRRMNSQHLSSGFVLGLAWIGWACVAPCRAEPAHAVPQSEMQRVYDEVKTPYKYGIILRPGEKESVDCPNVFRYGDKWYMVYVAIKDKVGYETLLAESDDLLNWKPLGKVLPFAAAGWDQWQADGSIALVDPAWGGSARVAAVTTASTGCRYFGGAKQGYETDPLAIGMAWTTAPDKPVAVDTPGQKSRAHARAARRPAVRAGHALQEPRAVGQIGVARLSVRDVLQRQAARAVDRADRHGRVGRHGPLVALRRGAGDRQRPGHLGRSANRVRHAGDLWVMFYFGAGWKPRAFDTFACSRDLVHWTKWTGPDLIAPSEPWDKTFAHKPWVLKHDGVVYHFYCAVGNEGRVIALATSKDLHPVTQPRRQPPANRLAVA